MVDDPDVEGVRVMADYIIGISDRLPDLQSAKGVALYTAIPLP